MNIPNYLENIVWMNYLEVRGGVPTLDNSLVNIVVSDSLSCHVTGGYLITIISCQISEFLIEY